MEFDDMGDMFGIPDEIIEKTEKEIKKMKEELKTIVRQHFRVDIHTPYCEEFEKKHPTCEGCESYDGCRIATNLLHAFSKTLMIAFVTGHEIHPLKLFKIIKPKMIEKVEEYYNQQQLEYQKKGDLK